VAATQELDILRAARGLRPIALRALGVLGAVAITVGSAIGAKEMQARSHAAPLMAEVSLFGASSTPQILPTAAEAAAELDAIDGLDEIEIASAPGEATPPSNLPAELLRYAADPEVRWFDGRPVRPAQKMWMTVTGYSPDEQSCGPYADGMTATLHSVKTNNMRLVAADPKVLAYGSMLTIPGYADQTIVPVLDCGGAIKGSRLDLLFPTHEAARQWGRKKVLVTVWAYADGKPAVNPRTLR
jgi:3D (Asp-Asp-Asp) domain-containing protein